MFLGERLSWKSEIYLPFIVSFPKKDQMSNNEWYLIKNINNIDSPALVIYKERVQQNILMAKNMVKNADVLRPHVKTNKMAEVCKMMMDDGIYKFKCATIAEAEMLAMINAKDVLFAYQPVGPKIERFISLMKKYSSTRFSCLIDNAALAEQMNNAAKKNDVNVEVFIDVNPGMNRTGTSAEKALQLFELLHQLKHIHIRGLHAYDGHIRDTDVTIRKQKSDEAFEKIFELANIINNKYGIDLTIIAGGSPTFPVHAARENVECSPGTFVFWDWGYKYAMPDEPFEYAALVMTRVISVIDETTICTDLGHKSVAAENALTSRVHFLNAPKAMPVSQSEEHLVLKVPDANKYQLGDVLYGVPEHICPTVALYDFAIVVEDDLATDEWKVIARDRKIAV